MKKTIVALMALAGVAMADTQVWHLGSSATSGDYLYDVENGNGLFTDNPDIDGTVLNSVNGANQIQTNISFVLNLTRAQALTADTKLLDMDMGGDIGLCLTSTGLATTWGGSTGSSRGSVSYDDLLADPGRFTTVNGDTCITLTFVQTYGSGVQVWSNTEKLINDTGLKSSGNTSLTSIYVNIDYIGCLQFTPEWKGDAIVETNAAFDAIVKERVAAAPSVPEPTTATLSLLALAGLAARRRRK